ncbi:LOW QUALITY PROTEIN: (MFS) transporter [Geosmithia morbida]|uniref:(MFS) transporter n=1 Tax=Geosmithia morbida TaxID=1094350 RepID=A0A9P5D2E2_9HYPO|nr:LOW QUALITY PROTEIN: (MFS) transporter [Geosmithia morbida]KAF4124953.1 LOW QUALITY PROTEIN: (MFS) transporter [Geosmithia morbida]
MPSTWTSPHGHRDWIPGTVHLVDLDSTVHARHAGGHNKDVFLVPKPSDDPDDPLNWSPSRKMTFLVCLFIQNPLLSSVSLFSNTFNAILKNTHDTRKLRDENHLHRYILAVGIASAAIYSVLVPISSATDLTVDDLNRGTGYMFLTFGWGCLVWQPMAQRMGKRPTYLLSLLATMVRLSASPPLSSSRRVPSSTG